MQILSGLEGLRLLPAGAVACVGNFDGVHRGHRRIIQTARQIRMDLNRPALAVVTFEPHTLTVLRPKEAPPRLTSPALKLEIIQSCGADYLVKLAPSPDVLNLTAEQFWQILRDQVRLSHLVEGQTFRFGKGAKGNVHRLLEWSASSPLKVHIVESVQVALLNKQVVPVSSSVIRFLLGYGRVREAAICLGRNYLLEGPVRKGHGRGRELGVPTANINVDDQLVPADAVYAGRCAVGGRGYAAAVSIGTMPTFGANQRQIEAHLIGFDGDLYGSAVRIELIDWLREQWKFPGPDALRDRMKRDVAEIKEIIGQAAGSQH